MPRIGRILPLGAAVLFASCADGTGPPDHVEQRPLGSIVGPGVSTAELHPLRHRMSIVSPGGLPLLHEVAQSSAGMPKLETGELKFELLLNGQHVAWHTVNIFPPSTESPTPTEAPAE